MAKTLEIEEEESRIAELERALAELNSGQGEKGVIKRQRKLMKELAAQGSRIPELERIAREGDEIEKMIAEVELAEERKRVARDAAYAIQEEEETETPLVPRIKSKTVLPKATKQVIENERAGFGKELERDVSEAVKELEPAATLENMPPMELLFTKKELALHKASEEAKLQKALGKVTAKSADEEFEQRERYRKDKLEKYPKATFKQRLVEGLGIGLTPATKANLEAARAVGAAMEVYDARTKLNNATSSAKSARVEGALGAVQTGAIVSVMTGMSKNSNLAHFNQVRPVTGSFYYGLLDVKKDATPKEEEAGLKRMLSLARLGNPTALLQTRAVEERFKALDAALKAKGTREWDAAQKRLTETLARTAADQSKYFFSEGGKAVNSDGVFDPSLLSEGVLEMMYDKRGSTNSAEWLTNTGLQVMSGANQTVGEDNKARIAQIRDNKPEAIRLEEETERSTGVPSTNPVSGQSDEQLGYSTNPKVLTDKKENLGILRAYVKETGKLPTHIGVATNRKNFLLNEQRNLLEEYKDASGLRKIGLKVALRKVRQGLIEADNDLTTAYQRIASDTEKLGATKDRDAELEKQDLSAGQKRIATLRASLPQSVLEMGNRGPKEEGIGKGGSMFDYIFLEKNAKGDGYSDVRDVFHPYLTPLNVGLGGKPLGKDEAGRAVILSSWATKVSSGMKEVDDTFKRRIDAYTDDTIKTAPDHIQAQYWAYHRAKDEWENAYPDPATATTPAAATPVQPAPVTPAQPAPVTPVQPAATTPVQPAAVAPPAVTNYPASWSTPLEVEPPAWPRPAAESKTLQNWRDTVARVVARTQAEGRSPNAAELTAIDEATAAKDVEVMRTMILEHPINPDTNNPWMVGDRMKYLGRDYLFYGGEWHLE